jgi:putative phosphoribosyl transferase
MTPENIIVYKNKEHAAETLAAKLEYFEKQKCSVIAISNGALQMGKFLAKHLKTNLTALPVEAIKDPADPLSSIGEVSFEFTIIGHLSRDIPQDYILHQGRILQANLISRYPDIYRAMDSMIRDRCVILVGNVTKHSDKIMACLEYVRKKKPGKLIAVVPVITLEAEHAIAGKVDELLINQLVSEESIHHPYPISIPFS